VFVSSGSEAVAWSFRETGGYLGFSKIEPSDIAIAHATKRSMEQTADSTMKTKTRW
jgi:hypothetical protein